MEQKKSRLLRLTLKGGQARVFLCDTTGMAQEARDIHHASNTCSAAMGRMIAATAIMGVNLKSDGDRITVTLNGGGPAGPMCAVAGPDGKVKVTIEADKLRVSSASKDALQTVIQFLRDQDYGQPLQFTNYR